MDNGGKLNKLLPKSISSKRLRQKYEAERDDHSQDADIEDDDRHDRGPGLSGSSRETIESDGTGAGSSHLRQRRQADDDGQQGDDGESYDSQDADRRTLSRARPAPLSSHPSQVGYLTTSSPTVQASHQPETQSPVTDPDSGSSSKSATFPAKRSDSNDSRDARSGRSKTGLLPPANPSRRSPSPGGKLKGIFRPKRFPSAANTSPERQSLYESSQASSQDGQVPPVPSLPILEPPAPAKAAAPDRRSRIQPKIDTQTPPRTPPTSDTYGPVIVNTPPTPVEASSDRKSISNASGFDNGSSPTKGVSPHRRSRSSSAALQPSKLSNIVTAPLTPTDESAEQTPNANPSNSFFSSMISAAQNAATSLSSNIQNTSIGIGGHKPSRPATPKTQESPDLTDTEEDTETPATTQMDDTKDQKESAVRTLGTGELSLSQLGLADPPSSVASPTISRFPDAADTRIRSESAPADPVSPVEVSFEESSSRPRSLYEAASGNEDSPQVDPLNAGGVQRTSSLRSALKQSHRKRNSSATTGTTIGAAIAAANSSLAHPNVSVPKLTGFAIASKKRNRDFHDLFKSVPDDDYLIEDYSCALQREILAHGRLYVSEGHLCFSSNILGWTTTLVMSFDEIVSVEKRSTALLFKNGLMISTLHAKHIFASFTSRDATYDLIVNIWKLGHPTLKSTLNGVRVEGTGGDKTEKIDAEPSGAGEDDDQDASESESGSEDDEEEYYDEDVHDVVHNTSIPEANGTETEADKSIPRKVSGAGAMNGSPPGESTTVAVPAGDFPGPASHAPTDCTDSATHYEKVCGDDIIPAPLGKVYSYVFGAASVTWMPQWLASDQKCFDIQTEDKKGLSLDQRTRSTTYIKPLFGSIGPKQTKCIVNETVDSLDFEKAISVTASTQTPDVPSGNVFCVKTRYCFSWAENNATRIQMNCTIEWSGKSWLKGPIEKGANDGQVTFAKDLFTALKAAVSSRPAAAPALPSAMKGKKKGKKSKTAAPVTGIVTEGTVPKRPDQKSWGLLEPVRGLLEPLSDIVRPLLTGNVVYGLFVGLIVATWFGFGFTPSRTAPSLGQDLGAYRPDRLAAYEEMWRREDTELWDWLEERVGMERLNSERPQPRKRAVEPRTVEENLRAARMDEREVVEAIRVTEDKLRVLKEVMDKKSSKSGARAAMSREGSGSEQLA